MRLTVQWSVNNELKVTVGTDATKLSSRSDRAKEKGLTRQGEAIEGYLSNNYTLDRLLQHSQKRAPYTSFEGVQFSVLGDHQPINPKTEYVNVLPEYHTYVDYRPDGKPFVAQRSTESLLQERKRHLDILLKSQEPQKKHDSHGRVQSPKRFTHRARHHLLEAGAAVDKLGLRECSSLLTLTIPGSTVAAYDAVSRWSGWIVNRQLQKVRDYLKGRPVYWFFVWEFQKRGALHQHWCVASDSYEESQHLSTLLKDAWYQCLREIGAKEGIDLFMREGGKKSWSNEPDKWQWNEQKVKKSVGKYFSKYVTKSHNEEPGSKGRRQSRLFYPSRWHGSSKSIKDVIKSHRLKVVIPNINSSDAAKLKEVIMSLFEDFEIVKSYRFDYRVETKDKRTIAEGQTTILYVSDSEYTRARATLSQFLGTVEQRRATDSEVYWHLHSAAMTRFGVTQNVLGNESGYGYQMVFR